MEPTKQTLTPPSGFCFIEAVADANFPSSSSDIFAGTTRGIQKINPDHSITMIGQLEDITKYVQDYLFNEENGELTVRLKSSARLFYNQDKSLDVNASKPAMDAIDAVLNQLAIKHFRGIDENGNPGPLTGLLFGKRMTNALALRHLPVKNRIWYREHYDDDSKRKIDFDAITHFAFDRQTYRIDEKGAHFSVTLKKEYKNDPIVLYALHRTLFELCGITRFLSET